MHVTAKRIGTTIAAVLFAALVAVTVAMVVATSSHEARAEGETNTAATATDTTEQVTSATSSDTATANSSSSNTTNADMLGGAATPQESGNAQSTEAADATGDCSLTLIYCSDPTGDEGPDAIFDDDGRLIMGTRTINGLHEGDVISAWKYVVNIPGTFFFDAWPATITISKDPTQNVFTYIYLKLWNYEYTVNYYLMTGANLEADNWKDALDTDDVAFYKMGSETFDNQQFGKLIDGDAYEYRLDGTYVIDTYPAQIRVGTDADDNVINVLYTPESTFLPDNVEVPDDIIPPPETETPPNTTPPNDTDFDKDDMDGLPGDFITGSDQIDITDDMLEHPISKKQAEFTKNAYLTGVEAGKIASTGDTTPILLGILIVVIIAAAGVIGYLVYRRRKDDRAAEAATAQTSTMPNDQGSQ